jgi:hypothetical protein
MFLREDYAASVLLTLLHQFRGIETACSSRPKDTRKTKTLPPQRGAPSRFAAGPQETISRHSGTLLIAAGVIARAMGLRDFDGDNCRLNQS